jgi:hypothetical protein
LSIDTSKKANQSNRMSTIKCFCGKEILMLPNVKAMSEAIEKHAQTHKQKIKDTAKAETEAERIRNYLITQTLDKASKALE